MEHDFYGKTFNGPVFCDFCSGFIWGLINQGCYCRACHYIVHHQCKTKVPANCAGRGVLTNPSISKVETPLILRTPITSKDSASSLNSWGESLLGVTNESENDHFKMLVQNLLIDESRIQYKSRLSLTNRQTYVEEKNQALLQIAQLVDKKKNLLKEHIELQSTLLKKKIGIVQKTDLSKTVGRILETIKECTQTIEIEIDQIEEACMVSSENNRKTVMIPANFEVTKLGEKIAQLQSLLRTLEISLNCNDLLKAQNQDLTKEAQNLFQENEILQRQIEELKTMEKQLIEQDKEKDLLMTQLSEFEVSIKNIKKSIGSTNELQVALRDFEDKKSVLKQELDQGEFSNPPSEDAYFKDAPDITFTKESGTPQVRAATINKIIERITHAKHVETALMKGFLMTYRSYLSPIELMEKMILRYCISPPSNSTPEDVLKFRKEVQEPIRVGVLMLIKYWIEHHYEEDWMDNDDLEKVMLDFVNNTVNRSGNANFPSLITEVLRKKKHGGESKITIGRKPIPEAILPKDISKFQNGKVSFLEIDPLELARQLTLIEHEFFKSIKQGEFLNLAWQKKDKERKAPNILKSIKHFNKISNWIMSEILSHDDIISRTSAMKNFIVIGEHCFALNNFGTIMQVVSALESTPIFRLKKSWDAIDENHRKRYGTLKDLLQTNYKKYREELTKANPPTIPYIGVWCTDLTFIYEGNPDTVGAQELINVGKLKLVANIMRLVTFYQTGVYNLKPVSEIRNWILSREDLPESEAYNRSLRLEPKKLQTML